MGVEENWARNCRRSGSNISSQGQDSKGDPWKRRRSLNPCPLPSVLPRLSRQRDRTPSENSESNSFFPTS